MSLLLPCQGCEMAHARARSLAVRLLHFSIPTADSNIADDYSCELA
jgi:hypothetical protein